MESSGKYEGSECGKVRLKLGGALLSDSHNWNKGLLPGGYGRKTSTLTMECV